MQLLPTLTPKNLRVKERSIFKFFCKPFCYTCSMHPHARTNAGVSSITPLQCSHMDEIYKRVYGFDFKILLT